MARASPAAAARSYQARALARFPSSRASRPRLAIPAVSPALAAASYQRRAASGLEYDSQ